MSAIKFDNASMRQPIVNGADTLVRSCAENAVDAFYIRPEFSVLGVSMEQEDIPVFFILVLIGAFFLYPEAKERYLHLSGICIETGTRLSDAEVIERVQSAALAHLSDLNAKLARDKQILGRFAPYERSDPCCRITGPEDYPWYEPPPRWVRRSGGFRASVTTAFLANDGRFVKGYYIIANCGALRSEMTSGRKYWMRLSP